jgi:4-hydroxy-2-oxoheptanedioate aldolase
LAHASGRSAEQYCAEANQQIMLVVMLETEEAIANVREIMAVPSVDVVPIGPGGLMIDVKARAGDETHHERLALEVAAALKETGAVAGYVCSTAEIADRRQAQGYRFLNYGLDHFVLLGGFGEIRDQARR